MNYPIRKEARKGGKEGRKREREGGKKEREERTKEGKARKPDPGTDLSRKNGH